MKKRAASAASEGSPGAAAPPPDGDGGEGEERGKDAAVAPLLRRLPMPPLPRRAGAGAREEGGEADGGSLAARRNAALERHQTSVPSQVAASVEERGAA